MSVSEKEAIRAVKEILKKKLPFCLIAQADYENFHTIRYSFPLNEAVTAFRVIERETLKKEIIEALKGGA